MVDRCKVAECDRQQEEIRSLKAEIRLLQRKNSTSGSGSGVGGSSNAEQSGTSSSNQGNVSTTPGSPITKKNGMSDQEKRSA